MDNRDAKVIATVACPHCGAAAGERCRNPIPQESSKYADRLLPEDRRPQPTRPHSERRAAWSDYKRGLL